MGTTLANRWWGFGNGLGFVQVVLGDVVDAGDELASQVKVVGDNVFGAAVGPVDEAYVAGEVEKGDFAVGAGLAGA